MWRASEHVHVRDCLHSDANTHGPRAHAGCRENGSGGEAPLPLSFSIRWEGRYLRMRKQSPPTACVCVWARMCCLRAVAKITKGTLTGVEMKRACSIPPGWSHKQAPRPTTGRLHQPCVIDCNSLYAAGTLLVQTHARTTTFRSQQVLPEGLSARALCPWRQVGPAARKQHA